MEQRHRRTAGRRIAVAREVDVEAVIANADFGAQGGVPQVAGSTLVVAGAVGRGHIGVAGKLIFGVVQLRGIAVGERVLAYVDAAVHALHVIGHAAAGVVHGDGALGHVGGAGGGRPVPAVAADFA